VELCTRIIENKKVYFRPGTTDENVLKEVIDKHCYRRVKDGFDVLKGESWLDLGANIGAFAVYCELRGANATCFEPDLDCYKVLTRNARKFLLNNMAVTHVNEPTVELYRSYDDNNHYRNTVFSSPRYTRHATVHNYWGGHLVGMVFNGVKMDIEGSEGGLIDKWLLPRCDKLVLEYHNSKDQSVENLARRLRILKKKFKHVIYPVELDNAIASGVTHFKSFFDRTIWCY
jgi:FkbM family methyltransferase